MVFYGYPHGSSYPGFQWFWFFFVDSSRIDIDPASSSGDPDCILAEIGANRHMLPLVWKEIDWQRLRRLTLGMLIATPVGVYLLSILPEMPT